MFLYYSLGKNNMKIINYKLVCLLLIAFLIELNIPMMIISDQSKISWVSKSLIVTKYKDGEADILPNAIYSDNSGIFFHAIRINNLKIEHILSYHDVNGESKLWTIADFIQGSPHQSGFISINERLFFILPTIIGNNQALEIFEFVNYEWVSLSSIALTNQIVSWTWVNDTYYILIRDDQNLLYNKSIDKTGFNNIGSINLNTSWGKFNTLNSSHIIGVSTLNTLYPYIWTFDLMINETNILSNFKMNPSVLSNDINSIDLVPLSNNELLYYISTYNYLYLYNLSIFPRKIHFIRDIKLTSAIHGLIAFENNLGLISEDRLNGQLLISTISLKLDRIIENEVLVSDIHSENWKFITSVQGLPTIVYSSGSSSKQIIKVLMRSNVVIDISKINLIENNNNLRFILLLSSLIIALCIPFIYIWRKKNDD